MATKAPAVRTASTPGPKPLQPPPEAAKIIEEHAATGFSVIGIARKLGTSKVTLARWLDEDQALRDAFDAGRERERQTLHNVLYRLATEQNDKIAAMFLLKARHGYREGEQEQQANRVAITFNLPGALKPEQFTIEANAAEPGTERLPTPRA